MQAKIQRRSLAARAYHKKRLQPSPEDNDGAVGIPLPSPALPLSSPSPGVSTPVASSGASPTPSHATALPPSNGTAGGDQISPAVSKAGPAPVGLIVGITLTLFAIVVVLGTYLYRRHSMRARMKLRGWVDKRGKAVISPWTDYKEKLVIIEPPPTATVSRGGGASAGIPLANGPPYVPPMRSSAYRSSQGAAKTSSTMETVKVTSTFIPTLPDELGIGVGDTLRVLEKYDDGWTLCLNQRGEKGMVPLECFDSRVALDHDAWRSSRISSLTAVQHGYA
jgi:hypothetical protein